MKVVQKIQPDSLYLSSFVMEDGESLNIVKTPLRNIKSSFGIKNKMSVGVCLIIKINIKIVKETKNKK